MESIRNITGFAWSLIVSALVVGIIAGMFLWPRIASRTPLQVQSKIGGVQPVFFGQELSIPNSKVIQFTADTIVIQDEKGQEASFPLSKSFKAIDTVKIAGGKSPQGEALNVGNIGTLVLSMSGQQYQAYLFYLTTNSK